MKGYTYTSDAQKGYDSALKELNEKYGDDEVVVNHFISKALSWPTIKYDNPVELDRFGVFLTECENAISSMDALRVLEYTDNMKQIVNKLPSNLHERWRNIVFQTKENGSRVKFSHLVKCVRAESKKANDPLFGREAMAKSVTPKFHAGKHVTTSCYTNRSEVTKSSQND